MYLTKFSKIFLLQILGITNIKCVRKLHFFGTFFLKREIFQKIIMKMFMLLFSKISSKNPQKRGYTKIYIIEK